MKDYYQILGVTQTSSAAQVKSAYRKLAMEHHPDKNPGNSESESKFKEISEAYEVLKDVGKKQQYDAELTAFRNPRSFHQEGPAFMYTGGFNGAMDIDEIMRDIRRSRGGWQEPPRNKDVNVTYSMTLEEAFKGKDAELTYNLPGKAGKTVNFKIPSGVPDGIRLRFAGSGDSSIAEVAPGDLFIRIAIMPHTQFIRHGEHLATAIQLDYLDAILGCEVEVPTIDGKPIKLRVPAGIQPGQSLRAAGKGMPVNNGPARGDMHIELVMGPPTLTDEQRQILEDVRKKKNS